MKNETAYSVADWKYHKNKLGYDDVIDKNGRLIGTIGVMDIATNEILNKDFDDSRPKEIFMLDDDGYWSIFIDAVWLTPQKVQEVLDQLGKLVNRKFTFDPYRLPATLEKKYAEKRKRYEKEIDEGHATKLDISSLSELPDVGIIKNNTIKKKESAISDKRLAEILTHKLKM